MRTSRSCAASRSTGPGRSRALLVTLTPAAARRRTRRCATACERLSLLDPDHSPVWAVRSPITPQPALGSGEKSSISRHFLTVLRSAFGAWLMQSIKENYDDKELTEKTGLNLTIPKAGYFVLATNDTSLTPAGALDACRRKDAIKKAFAGMKNQPGMRRLRAHSDATADGKLFCGFVALVMYMAVREALAAAEGTSGVSAGSVPEGARVAEAGGLPRRQLPGHSRHQ